MLDHTSQPDELELDEFFQTYRAACPEVEPGRNFMPNLWQRIESRQNFWFVFQRLVALNVSSSQQATRGSYTDALMAEHTAEKVYYTEAIRSWPNSGDVPEGFQVNPE